MPLLIKGFFLTSQNKVSSYDFSFLNNAFMTSFMLCLCPWALLYIPSPEYSFKILLQCYLIEKVVSNQPIRSYPPSFDSSICLVVFYNKLSHLQLLYLFF